MMGAAIATLSIPRRRRRGFSGRQLREKRERRSSRQRRNVILPGQYYDVESALNYNGQRYYDPTIGRFPQSDPTGLKGGISTYAYANNNSMMYSDPSGLNPGDPFSTASAAATDVLSYLYMPTTVNNVEYAGLIYKSGDFYYATTPVPGDYNSSNSFNQLAEQEDHDAIGMPVGMYHTHPYVHMVNGSPMPGTKQNTNFLTNCFSEKDKKIAKKAGGIFNPFTSYLGTPTGMLQYTPSTGVTTHSNYSW